MSLINHFTPGGRIPDICSRFRVLLRFWRSDHQSLLKTQRSTQTGPVMALL